MSLVRQDPSGSFQEERIFHKGTLPRLVLSQLQTWPRVYGLADMSTGPALPRFKGASERQRLARGAIA